VSDARRHVVVTGGTGGLGRGVVAALAEVWRPVVVTWIVEAERERTTGAFGDAVDLRRVDVRRREDVVGLAGELEATGGVWAVAHLVGGHRDGEPLAEMPLEGWREQIDLNLWPLVLTLGAFLPGMIARGGGRVVAVSSRAALRPYAGAAAYAATKAAVITTVQAASEEVKGHGVCVNAILPSVIDTPGNRAAVPDADHSRWVRPDEIGAVVRFLCSPEASAITGAAIPVYGRA